MAQPPSLDDDVPPTVAAIADSGPKSQAALDDYAAKATAKYAVKDYAAAAEFYSRATELQAELNGEMSPRNAELLYLYGRCLYQVAVQNSDVLGSKITGEEQARQGGGKSSSTGREDTKSQKLDAIQESSAGEKEPESSDQVAAVSESKPSTLEKPNDASDTTKPFFNITGDENWDVSDDEAAEGDNEDNAEDDEDDDFSNAFEVLDIARVLLERRLEELAEMKARQEEEEKAADLGKTVLETKKLRERLADTRDLQAEIGLEAERFTDAAVDLRAALDIKKELFALESSMIAEAHYKLSLALEFSAISPALDANGDPQPGTVGKVDQSLRDEAAEHMAKAIESCKARVALEQKLLDETGGTEYEKTVAGADGDSKVKITPQSVKEVQEMVADMEQRLKELREPPISIQEATSRPDPGELSGILGTIMGDTAEVQRAKLEEAVGKANDLSGLVKRKKPAPDGKRKADEPVPESESLEKKSRHE